MESSPAPNPLFVWIRGAVPKLESIGAGNPRLEAEYMMSAALGIDRIKLWLYDTPPEPEQLARFEELLTRRLAREPLQYVLGTAEFAGLTLDVGPGVFIPRSETEVLVEHVVGALRDHDAPRIVDVGTGSGAILLALLDRIPAATGTGIDILPAALECAHRNAEKLGLSGRAMFLHGDLLKGIEPGSVDAVICNPPYIALSEADDLAPEIRDNEPVEALFAGTDGLDSIRELIPQAAELLPAGGLLALEIGITQGPAVRDLLGDGKWDRIELHDDLAGRPRVVLALRV